MTAETICDLWQLWCVHVPRYDRLEVTCELGGAGMLSVRGVPSWWGPALGAGCADATLGRGRLPTSFTCARTRFFRTTDAARKQLKNTEMLAAKARLVDGGRFVLFICPTLFVGRRSVPRASSGLLRRGKTVASKGERLSSASDRCVGECCDSAGEWVTDGAADYPSGIWLSDARTGPVPPLVLTCGRGGGSFCSFTAARALPTDS